MFISLSLKINKNFKEKTLKKSALAETQPAWIERSRDSTKWKEAFHASDVHRQEELPFLGKDDRLGEQTQRPEGTSRLSHSLQATQPVRGRARFQTEAARF